MVPVAENNAETFYQLGMCKVHAQQVLRSLYISHVCFCLFICTYHINMLSYVIHYYATIAMSTVVWHIMAASLKRNTKLPSQHFYWTDWLLSTASSWIMYKYMAGF